MTLRSIFKVAEKYAIDNSPTLISAIAVTGTMATAWLTGKATFKAAKMIDAEEERRLKEHPTWTEGDRLEKKEAALLVWKEYIPPAAAVIGTVACIVTANSISASRLAGMAAAYKLTESQYSEYKEKVKEKLGIQDEKRMRDELNEERVRNNPPSDDIQILATEDEVIFLESWTGRYFRSKMHLVRAAENHIDRVLVRNRHATLTDFYDQLGLARTQESSEIGWTLESPISLDFTTTLADGGSRPVIVMEYSNLPRPIRDWVGRGYSGSEDYVGIH